MSSLSPNFVHYHAGNPLNRCSWVRPDVEFVQAAATADSARYLLFDNLNPLCHSDPASDKLVKLVSVGYNVVKAFLPDPITAKPEDFKAPVSAEAESKKPGLVFLGVQEGEESRNLPEKAHRPEGPAFFALDVSNLPELKATALSTLGQDEKAAFTDLRAGQARLSPPESGIVSEARSLLDWNQRNRFCAACGNALVTVWAGWKKACVVDETSKPCITRKGIHNIQYPRTDPVCIMAVLHPTEDKILLGRNKSWPKGFMSCLAGFLEPGESIEEAVKREVWEEAGIRCSEVYYASSQPWPYPSSLMLGAIAIAEPNQTINLDLDNELEQALWVSREFVLDALDNRAGISKAEAKQFELGRESDQDGKVAELTDVRLPPDSAIAHVLIASWARGEWKRPAKP